MGRARKVSAKTLKHLFEEAVGAHDAMFAIAHKHPTLVDEWHSEVRRRTGVDLALFLKEFAKAADTVYDRYQ